MMDGITLEMKRTTAIRVAVIAGVFSLIVAGFMFVNYSRRLSVEPGMEKQLEDMKNVFRDHPDNQKLAGEIRQFDLEIRNRRMRWLAFSGKGAVLLLCGLGVFVGCLKYAGGLGGVKPVVEGETTDGVGQERRTILSRRFVWGGFAVLLLLGVLIGFKPSVEYVAEDTWEQFLAGWPTFRGPDGSGVSKHKDVSLEFDGESGTGVLWKSPVPMDGMNSPVLWGDFVFLSGGDEKKLQVYCYDAKTGKPVWTRDVESMLPEGAEVEPMEDTGFSAPTLAVDGKRVYAIFATGDVVAFDFSGKKVWAKFLGVPDSVYGYASSLAMYKKLLIIQYDQGADDDNLSKLYALDGFSGQPVWQINRPVANSWTSPVVVDVEGKSQIITCAKPFAISYDAGTGAELWRVECEAEDIAPSSVYAGGLVFVIKPNDEVMAIKRGGRGDVTKSHIAWKNDEVDVPDICSPVSDGEFLYILSSDGVLTCIDFKGGKVVWDKDLDEMFQSSPSIVGGKLVMISEKGNLIVAETGLNYKEISRSKLGERCFASPAFADGRMYIRGNKNLYCIGKKD
ncbi:MAG: PQQ-binding-like beta-propeller repeat protein [Planctomycetes bacterium]|nr:PQQ-binding-like beta-propeller repeat protein [Planctomycetota bacterium]